MCPTRPFRPYRSYATALPPPSTIKERVEGESSELDWVHYVWDYGPLKIRSFNFSRMHANIVSQMKV